MQFNQLCTYPLKGIYSRIIAQWDDTIGILPYKRGVKIAGNLPGPCAGGT